MSALNSIITSRRIIRRCDACVRPHIVQRNTLTVKKYAVYIAAIWRRAMKKNKINMAYIPSKESRLALRQIS